MIFIDYVSMLLLNMAGGLAVVALFLWSTRAAYWSAGLAVAGVVAMICGLHMIFVWPLPGSFNIAFGETSVMLGAVLLGAALAVGKGWSLVAVAVYGLVASLAAIVLGLNIYAQKLTAAPVPSAVGFIVTGAGGVLAAFAVFLSNYRTLGRVAAVLLLAAAALWAYVGLSAYPFHLKGFGKYKPAVMQTEPAAGKTAATQAAATEPAE